MIQNKQKHSQNRVSIWFNLAVTNTTNYSSYIYSNQATATIIITIYLSSSPLSLSPPSLFVYYYYLHRSICSWRYYYNYYSNTFILFHTVLIAGLVHYGGGDTNGMEWSVCGETTLLPSSNNIHHATSNIPHLMWFNPAVTSTKPFLIYPEYTSHM